MARLAVCWPRLALGFTWKELLLVPCDECGADHEKDRGHWTVPVTDEGTGEVLNLCGGCLYRDHGHHLVSPLASSRP